MGRGRERDGIVIIGFKNLNAPYSLYLTGELEWLPIYLTNEMLKSFRSRLPSSVAFNGKPQKFFFFL